MIIQQLWIRGGEGKHGTSRSARGSIIPPRPLYLTASAVPLPQPMSRNPTCTFWDIIFSDRTYTPPHQTLLFDDERASKRSCPSFANEGWAPRNVEWGQERQRKKRRSGGRPHSYFAGCGFLNQGARWGCAFSVFCFSFGFGGKGDWVVPH